MSSGAARAYLIVIDSLDCGGAERHAVELAAGLCDRGHSVTLASSAGGRLSPEAERAGAEVEAFGRNVAKRRFSPRYARAIRRLLAQRHFDLVHAHLYASSVAATAALAAQRTPLVVTEQTEGLWRSAPQRAASRIAYRRSSRVIGVSRAITRSLIDEFGVPPEKVAYVPNGVRLPEPAAPRPFGGGPAVGLVARLVPEKDVLTFLQCARQLIDRYPDARFPIAGDGPLRSALLAAARELGIADRVEFLGVRDEMAGFFSGLDVLAVSSVAEGTPLAIVEAMGAGVPVVATDVGGIPDQIETGVTGLLVGPRDPAALAGGIARVLEDSDFARRLAVSARERADAEFSIESAARKIEAIYERVIGDSLKVSSAAPSRDARVAARERRDALAK